MVADDSALFREGLVTLLRAAGLQVVAEAATADELLAAVALDPPDAVVLDVRMPPTSTDEGLVAAGVLKERHPGVGVLVLSTYSETAYAVRLLDGGRGGVGYLLKDQVCDVAALVDALRRVGRGQSVIDPEIVVRLISARSRVDVLDGLTARERDVLRHMAEGRTNAGIGRALGLAARTVETHVNSVFSKLDLPPGGDGHRRVLAVLTWLRSSVRDD